MVRKSPALINKLIFSHSTLIGKADAVNTAGSLIVRVYPVAQSNRLVTVHLYRTEKAHNRNCVKKILVTSWRDEICQTDMQSSLAFSYKEI